ncbi:calcium-binding protein [Rhodobacter sp. TJ_12]|uniref:calcium-binding protein n=1 Tax=Rhodobacter sp. TJ_12 TaxID=2029399 RepID=UPI001CC0106E|nr:calcium-binding protein [Rhodobacter sp. TJ_12]
MFIEFSGRVVSGSALLDTDIRQLEVVAGARGTFLYTATGANGGLACYDISTGTPVLTDSVYFYGSMISMGLLGLEWMPTGTTERLIFGVTQRGDLLAANVAQPGDLGSLTTIYLNDTHSPWLQSGLQVLTRADGTTMAFVVDALSGDFEGYALSERGAATHVTGAEGTADTETVGPVLLESLRCGGTDYLLRADTGLQGVAAYAVGADGALRYTSQLGAGNGLGVNTPTALETVTAWGQSFVLLAAAESGTLSVMRLSADGRLWPTDHLLDTRDTRFGGVTALEVVTVGERVLVIAGGADDGVSLFTLLSDGRLVHLQTLVHQAGDGLENITAIAGAVVGDSLRLHVTSGTDRGLSLLEMDLSHLGLTRDGEASGDTLIEGSGAADLLVSNSSGADTLRGGAGADVLVSGPGATRLLGGAGADTFVIRAAEHRQFILDYEAGDRIDLTGLPMLRSTAQLEATPTAVGLMLRYIGYEIEIIARDGRPLALTDIWPGLSFAQPDRVMVLADMPGLQMTGTDRSEQISGSDFDDSLFGAGGDDRIAGGAGHDTLSGDDGQDTLVGDVGDDLLKGGAAQDWLDGGSGDDSLLGEGGNDVIRDVSGANTVHGGAGADTITTGAGNDLIVGGANTQSSGDLGDSIDAGAGDDVVWSGFGNDTVLGGAGADTLGGEDGDDAIEAGLGDDRVFAGAGSDTVEGGAGTDTIYGQTGNDMIRDLLGSNVIDAGAGADTVFCGAGNDLIVGGTDAASAGDLADSLVAGAGDDTLWSGYGNDTLFGDAGDDLLGGGLGDDFIFGGAGADRLLGQGGADTLTGGAGADEFIHDGTRGAGADVITDFDGTMDRLLFLNTAAGGADFTVERVNLSGEAGIQDLRIIFAETGIPVWTLIDAADQTHIWLQIEHKQYDLAL